MRVQRPARSANCKELGACEWKLILLGVKRAGNRRQSCIHAALSTRRAMCVSRPARRLITGSLGTMRDHCEMLFKRPS